MKEVIIKVPEKEYSFFRKLISNLGFEIVEKTKEGDSKEEIFDNLRHGFNDLKKFKEGKLATTPAKDFLDEL